MDKNTRMLLLEFLIWLERNNLLSFNPRLRDISKILSDFADDSVFVRPLAVEGDKPKE